jgi:Uma2 family endonuclease
MVETTAITNQPLVVGDTSPSPVTTRPMTFEQFMAWADEDAWAELVQGEIVMMTPASNAHQSLLYWLSTILGRYVQLHNLGWLGLAPFAMRLEEKTVREPDLLFVSTEHLERVKETYLDGPTDLVIEIVSPESIARDWGDKFYEYQRAGIPEYWLIDPQTGRAEFYQLDSSGRYRPVAPDADGVYRSQMVRGFWLKVEWLCPPLPDPEDVLLEVGGTEYAASLIERLRKRGLLPE